VIVSCRLLLLLPLLLLLLPASPIPAPFFRM
jgi:hypothetical protein